MGQRLKLDLKRARNNMIPLKDDNNVDIKFKIFDV